MTTTITHPAHPRLVSFAKGALPPGPRLTVASHVATCADCRDAVAAREEMEGLRLVTSPPAEMRPDALETAFQVIDAGRSAPVPGKARTLGDMRVPDVLRDVQLGRRRFLGPEVWVAHVVAPDPAGWLTYLLRAPAGARFPNHDHSGPEFISLIEGSYSDGRGHEAGDFAENGPGDEHIMEISSAGPCLCLISTYGPIPWPPADRIIGRSLGV